MEVTKEGKSSAGFHKKLKNHGIAADPSKEEVLLNWEKPNSVSKSKVF